jgi:Uncharacterized protein conserved in bacteria (DUF2188)
MKSVHVVSNPSGGWSVRKSGANRATRVFSTQTDAIGFARKTAKAQHSELYVHGSNGQIRERNSYGNDTSLQKVSSLKDVSAITIRIYQLPI